MSTLSALGQVALLESDIDASETFYRDALELMPLFRYGEVSFFNCGGVRLILQSGEPTHTPGNTLCLYFRVAHIHAAMAELKARGVAFEAPPKLMARMPDHELWMSFFRDPDGYQLALMEERREP